MMGASDLADRLGLKKSKRDWRGRCPACSYPTAFSLRQGQNGKPLLWCANCQDKDAIFQAVRDAGGSDWTPPEPRAKQSETEVRERKQEAARRCWSGSLGLSSTVAEAYLWSRLLGFLTASAALRYRSDTSHPQGGRLPALLALVTDVADEPVAVHRTYLDRNTCGKADVAPAKASLGPVWGGAIRLTTWKPDLPLVIGEGIETAASAGSMMGAPAWAAISAGNLAIGLQLPPEVRDVVIAADPDAPGEDAAKRAARRWAAEGRNVRIARPAGGGDFNDVLRREIGHG